MLELMMHCDSYGKHDMSSLRVGQTSGGSIPPEHLLKILTDFGLEHFIMGYGQTECAPLVTLSLYNDKLEDIVHCAGKPLPNLNVRIWDENSDSEALQGCVGEIQVKGPVTMIGYYNCPEENAKKFTQDGWLKTTDAGWFDENGYLHFSSRISEIIIRHGENISPCEIENVVKLFSKDITAVKVVGVEADIVGEEIVCIYEAKEGSIIDENELRAFIKRTIASYKVPKYIFRIEELPRTSTSKIDISQVRIIVKELVKKL